MRATGIATRHVGQREQPQPDRDVAGGRAQQLEKLPLGRFEPRIRHVADKTELEGTFRRTDATAGWGSIDEHGHATPSNARNRSYSAASMFRPLDLIASSAWSRSAMMSS